MALTHPALTYIGAKDGALTLDLLMNIMRAFHELTRIAVQTHGGRTADYNNPATWQCASAAVRMQRDLEALMRAHKECGRYRTAAAAARMIYAIRSAA